jgi:tRNA A-37 threonylcarbamoyl transferase component Bud32
LRKLKVRERCLREFSANNAKGYGSLLLLPIPITEFFRILRVGGAVIMPRVVCPLCRTGFEANISKDNFALNCVACGVAFNAAHYLSKEDFSAKAEKRPPTKPMPGVEQGTAALGNAIRPVEPPKFAEPLSDSTRTGGLPFMAESDDASQPARKPVSNTSPSGTPSAEVSRPGKIVSISSGYSAIRRLPISHPLSPSAQNGQAAALAKVQSIPKVEPPSVIGLPTPPPMNGCATNNGVQPASPSSPPSVQVAPPGKVPQPVEPQAEVKKQEKAPEPAPAPVNAAPAAPEPAPQPELPQPAKKNRRPLLEGTFGPYDIEGEIARGGVGAVFKARERDTGRQVALKVLLDGEEAGEAERERFRHECETAKALSLPGMVQVYAVGELDQRPYMAMELVKGRSLDKVIPEKGLSVNDCLVLMKSVAETIGALHEAGYVHRDLKPGNILIDEFGSPKVADFGLVKSLDEVTRLTASGLVCGTPAYMAPEQARGDGKAVDPRSDVWALGAVLYEMLTSRPPFRAENALRLMLKITKSPPELPRSLNLKVPQHVENIVMRCLEKSAEKRYTNARALAADIGRFLNGEPLEPASQPKVQLIMDAAARNRRPLIVSGIAVAVLIMIALVARFFFAPKAAGTLIAKAYTTLQDTTQADRWKVAEGMFREASKIDPKNGKAQLGLGLCVGWQAVDQKKHVVIDKPRFTEGVTETLHAAELDPQLDADAHFQASKIFMWAKQHLDEAHELEMALKKAPGVLKFKDALAMAYWNAGSQMPTPADQQTYYAKALNEFQGVLQQDPTYPKVAEYIRRLKEEYLVPIMAMGQRHH